MMPSSVFIHDVLQSKVTVDFLWVFAAVDMQKDLILTELSKLLWPENILQKFFTI
jgi:hypothetical protein